MAVLPMFPLGATLLPGAVLPLQVFEPRYRQMVHDILADDVNQPEFGVVMIERGREVGGGDERTSIGTIARVFDIRALPDGRYRLAAVGSTRLRVNAWLPDDPYPIADVDEWPDDPDDLGTQEAARRIGLLHTRVRSINDQMRTLGEMTPPPDTEISDDPTMAAYHLASLSPLGPADRHRLLASPTLAARLTALGEALDDVEAMLAFRRT